MSIQVGTVSFASVWLGLKVSHDCMTGSEEVGLS